VNKPKEEKMNLQRQPRNLVLVRVASMVLALSCLASGVAVAESPAASETITVVASTVPANGDVNPYGIFVVPDTVGNLVKGNLLISNFNASSNLQGNRNYDYADIAGRHRQPVCAD
jgi:hypothetical protein